MPKIALRYMGDDKAMRQKLEATDGVQYFEPVDAREILATPGNDYEPDEESRKLLGIQFDPRLKGLNVPQLHGADAELQTGLSAEKYGRSQVVQAVPSGVQPTAFAPMTTTGRPLSLDDAREGAGAGSGDPRMGFQQPQETGDNGGKPASEGMTVEQMRDALKSKGVQFPHDAKKAELAELVDRNAR